MDFRPKDRNSDQSLDSDRSGRSSGRGPESWFGTERTGFEIGNDDRVGAENGRDREGHLCGGIVGDRCAAETLVGVMLEIGGFDMGKGAAGLFLAVAVQLEGGR